MRPVQPTSISMGSSQIGCGLLSSFASSVSVSRQSGVAPSAGSVAAAGGDDGTHANDAATDDTDVCGGAGTGCALRVAELTRRIGSGVRGLPTTRARGHLGGVRCGR